MTRLFALRPEVAGGWGPKTVVANRAELESGAARVPEVTYLEYEFQGWLGDEILETFPCYIVTNSLADDMRRANLSGAHFSIVEVSVTELFRELHPDLKLPVFWRLVPEGKVQLEDGGRIKFWSGHDVCLSESGRLVVSEHALEVLSRHTLRHCKIQSLNGEVS